MLKNVSTIVEEEKNTILHRGLVLQPIIPCAASPDSVEAIKLMAGSVPGLNKKYLRGIYKEKYVANTCIYKNQIFVWTFHIYAPFAEEHPFILLYCKTHQK